jgi:hypothetical protein
MIRAVLVVDFGERAHGGGGATADDQRVGIRLRRLDFERVDMVFDPGDVASARDTAHLLRRGEREPIRAVRSLSPVTGTVPRPASSSAARAAQPPMRAG